MSFGAVLEDVAGYVGGSFSGAPSERDFFQNALSVTGDLLIKRTQEHYLGEKSLPPKQTLSAPVGTAAGNNAMISSPMKAVLIVGGIVLGVLAIGFGLSMIGGRKK